MGAPQNAGPAWIDANILPGNPAFNGGSPASSRFLISAHGALYLYENRLESGGSNINGCGIYKSIDGGNTWVLQDEAGEPTTAFGSMFYDAVNDKITCALVTQTFPISQQTTFLQDFDLNGGAGESWGSPYATGGPVAETNIPYTFLRSDLSIVIIYDLGAGNNPGGTSRLRAAVWDGLAWGSSIDVGVAILPAQAAGNILVTGTCAEIDANDIIHLAFGNSSGVSYAYQQLLADDSLGQSDTFTSAGLGLSGNTFRSLAILNDNIFISFPAASFTNPSVLIGTPVSGPTWSQLSPVNMAQSVGFLNRGMSIATDGLTLYWMISFFDAGTGSFTGWQIWTSDDDGATWTVVPDNAAANYFYNFEQPGGSPQAPNVDQISGVLGLTFTLITEAGVTTAYGFVQARNTDTGDFQTYYMNLEEFAGPEVLSIAGDPPDGTVGAAYGFCFSASGGTPPYSFAITAGSIPPGTTLDASTGCITGTPTTAGNFCFTITVTDAALAMASTSPCVAIVAGSLIIQLIGWKLYPAVPCADFETAKEIPPPKWIG